MNKRERMIKLCNMFCALAMAVLLVLQFMPFWYSVGGVHKTKDEYLDWSATYIPVAERPTESKAPETTAATDATTVATAAATTEATTEVTTEATTDATAEATTDATAEATTDATAEATTDATAEATTDATAEATEPTATEPTATEPAATEPAASEPAATEPAATEPAATEPKKDASGRPGRPSKNNGVVKNPYDAKNDRAQSMDQSQAVKPTAPPSEPTDPEIKKMSIASSVWRYNTYKEGQEAPLLMFHIAILGFGAIGVFFCLTKAKKSINCIWVMATAILGTLGYFTNAGARTGMAWWLHGGISAFLLIPGIALTVFWIKDLIDWFTKVEA